MIGRPPKVETPEALAKRFWGLVEKAEGCWLWKGTRCKGYGTFSVRNPHRKVRANRVAWEVTYGPIPAGLQALHRCDNPPCVRPEHLFLGTPLDNIKDRMAKGRGGYKLSVEDVRAIRQIQGKTLVSIAAIYGVAFTTISKIRRREMRKEVA